MCVGCFFRYFLHEKQKKNNREKKEKKKGAVSSLFFSLRDNNITKINQ
tara:strand:+ start:220 stop:363 length:144 start_codon:yes stop_codon:yes gene_type:complete